MRIRPPRGTGPVLALLGSAVLGGLVAVEAPQVTPLASRPSCAETVMKAISSEKPVNGTYGCFDRPFQMKLSTNGINSDSTFAERVGQSGEYHYLRKTEDGGYVYEYDHPMNPHDKVHGALNALGLFRITADVEHGNVGKAWGEHNDFKVAWAEITGATQNPQSTVYTFYVDSDGKIWKVS